MPIPNHSYFLDEMIQISTGDLRQIGYLKRDRVKSGNIIWTDTSDRGQAGSWWSGDTREISIEIVIDVPRGVMLLNYETLGTKISDKFELESVPSNLGVGHVYYFVCPMTSRRCRKLYLMGQHFLSRYACLSAIYSCQSLSKSVRPYRSSAEALSEKHRLQELLSKPYAKALYRRKPTRRFARLLGLK